MSGAAQSPFVDIARGLAPQIEAAAEEAERERHLRTPLIDAFAQAGLFRLWIPRALGGEEVEPETFVRVVEEISRIDGAAGWCVMIGGCYGAFGGYLSSPAAREIYGADPRVITGGAFRPFGRAVVVDGGYRVTGRWPLGSGCQHCAWMVGGCQILDGETPRLAANGVPVTRLLFFPAASCEIIDTWYASGLRGTGSHDYAVADLLVPAEHSLSFREPPVETGPLYAIPTIGLFALAIAAVALGIARHAIDILTELARTKIASRSRQVLNQNAMTQADLGRAEGLLRSGHAFLYETLDDAWRTAVAGERFGIPQRALMWLAATQATTAAAQAADLMFTAGGSASVYSRAGLDKCVRDIRAVGQHVVVAPGNYEMAGQALLGMDMRATLLLALDDRDAARRV